MSKRERFSKKTLAEYIKARLSNYDFDRGNGWAQVNGKGEHLNRDYGAFDTLMMLAAEFDLDVL